MTSKSKVDAILFGRKHKSSDIHNKRDYSNEHDLEFVSGQGNQRYRGNEAGPFHLPPVPVVLNPIPVQITPIGTIPIYPRRTSRTS